MTKQKRWSMIMTLLTCWAPLVMMSHNSILLGRERENRDQ